MTAQQFPGKLKRLRKSLGLTQAAAARILGLTANSLARWERGERCPPAERDVLTRERVISELRESQE